MRKNVCLNNWCSYPTRRESLFWVGVGVLMSAAMAGLFAGHIL